MVFSEMNNVLLGWGYGEFVGIATVANLAAR